MSDRTVVIFDLDQTLGHRTAVGDEGRFVFNVYPGVEDVLGRVCKVARLGVIASGHSATCPPIDSIVAEAGLAAYFDSALVQQAPLTSTALELVAQRAGVPVQDCLLVSPDRARREVSRSAGFAPCPHPYLVESVLRREALVYLLIKSDTPGFDLRPMLLLQRPATGPVVPIHVPWASGETVLAIGTARAIDPLIDSGLTVNVLGAPDLPATTDVCLLAHGTSSGGTTMIPALSPSHPAHLTDTGDGLLVSLGSNDSERDLPRLSVGCGAVSLLQPSLTLLESVSSPAPPMPPSPLDSNEIEILNRITAQTIVSHHARWCGLQPLNGDNVVSRFWSHSDNGRVVAALSDELVRLGQGRVAVSRPSFVVAEGPIAENIEAELAADPSSPVKHEIVVLGAHLDSTAPNINDAPGADDDASGIAAILAAAEVLSALTQLKAPQRTIRLVLFNAEEVNMVGSRNYVADRYRNDRFVAMYQLDMIGWRATADDWGYELHPGGTEWPTHQESHALANLVVSSAAQVSPVLTADIHPHPTCVDPGDRRSDHYWFQYHRIPACLVTEDLFVEVCGEKIPIKNPHYHTTNDRCIWPEYTAEIARAVIAATWRLANA